MGLLAAAALCPGALARAEPGVIEINQVSALAGAVTPGDAAGFPVTLDSPGSYRLTGNLDVSGQTDPQNVTAIEIAASGVQLDLGGFEIRGPVICTFPVGIPVCSPAGTGSGIALQAGAEASRLEIRNGRISRMGAAGILLGDGVGIEGLTVSGCAGTAIECGQECRVAESMAAVNGGAGIRVASDSRVLRSTALLSAGPGILSSSADGTLVQQSTASQNGAGIVLSGAALALGNVIEQNGGPGLELSSAAGYAQNLLRANTATGISGVNLGRNACDGAICP